MRSRFECARITRMRGVNLFRFEFDYDTTWNAFFLDADLNIYSRYGGRDGEDPEGRVSKESLLQTMIEVLEVHKDRLREDPEDTTGFQRVPGAKSFPEDIPLLQRNHYGCVHCHHVREYQMLQAFREDRFDRRMLFPFPLPDNVGLRFDRAHGHRIEQIVSGSIADGSGLEIEDVVTRTNDVPIHSEYDFRWVLHNLGDSEPLLITVRRQTSSGTVLVQRMLQPGAGWRMTDLSWRRSLRSVPFQIGFNGKRVVRLNQDEPAMAIKVHAVLPRGFARSLRLEVDDVIVAVGDDRTDLDFRQFKSLLLRRHKPGDDVELVVLRNGEEKQLKGVFPRWYTAEISVK